MSRDDLASTIMLYGAPPIDSGEPWKPVTPFTPGIQPIPGTLPQPPFTVAQGGPEPIEQIRSRIQTRISEIEQKLAEVEPLRDELRGLKRMLEAFVEWDKSRKPREETSR